MEKSLPKRCFYPKHSVQQVSKIGAHDSVTDDFGVVRMHRRDFPILVKKGGAFKLVKGGRHLMLYEKKQEATEKHILILELESKQRIEIDVEERNR